MKTKPLDEYLTVEPSEVCEGDFDLRHGAYIFASCYGGGELDAEANARELARRWNAKVKPKFGASWLEDLIFSLKGLAIGCASLGGGAIFTIWLLVGRVG